MWRNWWNWCAVVNPKVAVVLFNLGGPDSPEAVKPFLTNLFSDPAIIGLPQPFRGLLAWWIAKRRTPHAQEIYAQLGGKSPIVPNTEAQARALEVELGEGFKCFIAMRYWHPRADDTRKEVAAYQPDTVVKLPLYPQYSTTTTASSFSEWGEGGQAIGCYPINPGFIQAQVELIKPVLDEAKQHGTPRLLFSAHGLPEKIIKAGDPYQWQCEQTAQAIAKALGEDVEWLNCYQSRVGRLKWIEPYTEQEIRRAGADKRPLVVVPIAFVSEHSETLVELDIEYRDLARESGVPSYGRVPTVGTHPTFIKGLADLVRESLAGTQKCAIPCPSHFSACACRE